MSTKHVNKIGQQTRRQQIMSQPTLSTNSVNKYGSFSKCQKWRVVEWMVWRHGDSQEHGWVPSGIRSLHVWQRLVWFFYCQRFRYEMKSTKYPRKFNLQSMSVNKSTIERSAQQMSNTNCDCQQMHREQSASILYTNKSGHHNRTTKYASTNIDHRPCQRIMQTKFNKRCFGKSYGNRVWVKHRYQQLM